MRVSTALLLAAFNGHLELVRWLVEEAGAILDERVISVAKREGHNELLAYFETRFDIVEEKHEINASPEVRHISRGSSAAKFFQNSQENEMNERQLPSDTTRETDASSPSKCCIIS